MRWNRIILLLTVLGVLIPKHSVSADSSPDPAEWVRGVYTKGSPTARPLPVRIAWSEARALARRTPRAFILAGSGQSMWPLYPHGTVLVVAPKPFGELSRGMTVVYRNEATRPVAHVLVARTETGWRVTGLNNRHHDGEGVNPANFVGVVIAAFTPVEGTGLSQR